MPCQPFFKLGYMALGNRNVKVCRMYIVPQIHTRGICDPE